MTRDTVAWLTPALAAMSASVVATIRCSDQDDVLHTFCLKKMDIVYLVMKDCGKLAKEILLSYTFNCLESKGSIGGNEDVAHG
jgi:hypothetical protein